MKKINRNNLEEIKSEFNTLVESKIAELNNKEAIKSVDKMPLYQLKNLFESITSKLYESSDGKKCIGRYVKTISGSPSLKAMFIMTEMVSKCNTGENTRVFLDEGRKIFCEANKKNTYAKSLKKLASVVESAVRLVNISADSINEAKNSNTIGKSVDYILLESSKDVRKLPDYITHVEKVNNFINENRKEGKDTVTESALTIKDLVAEGMEDWEKKAVDDIFMSNLAGKGKNELFEDYKNECIKIMEESMIDESVETKARIETMKLQLENKQFNEESFIDDILKLAELKETL